MVFVNILMWIASINATNMMSVIVLQFAQDSIGASDTVTELQRTSYCNLIPSSLYFNTCPDGYTEHNKHNPAETSNDLVAFQSMHAVYPDWACYAKITGITKLILFYHDSFIRLK